MLRRIVPIVIVAVGVTTSALGQNRRWFDPYQRGVAAVEARKFDAAVKLLEQAVAVESRQGASKYVEGVFRTDYFPYYYLGVAYLELKQYDKARENFTKARTGLSPNLLVRLTEFEKRVSNETSSVRVGGNESPPTPTVNTVNPNFEPAIRQADAAVAAKRYQDAFAAFDAAKNADQAEYTRQNIQARRDEVTRAYAVQVAEEGRQLLQTGKLNQAKADFQQAEQLAPGQKPAQDGLAEIKRREDDFQRLKAGAESDERSQNFAAARDKLEQARTAHPELFTAENLASRLTVVSQPIPPVPRNSTPLEAEKAVADGRRLLEQAVQLANQGKYAQADAGYAAALRANPKDQEAASALEKSRRFVALTKEGSQLEKERNLAVAQQRFVEARAVDARRFERERLTAVLDRLLKSTGEQQYDVVLREGLLALFKEGDAAKSIAILEPTVAGRAGGPKTAALYAYLGVAYASRALATPGVEDQARLRARALEQFRLARSAQPDYQLSSRLVSPKILALFNQVPR
jgi:tetratricopeptide (TPR) repeat protein